MKEVLKKIMDFAVEGIPAVLILGIIFGLYTSGLLGQMVELLAKQIYG